MHQVLKLKYSVWTLSASIPDSHAAIRVHRVPKETRINNIFCYIVRTWSLPMLEWPVLLRFPYLIRMLPVQHRSLLTSLNLHGFGCLHRDNVPLCLLGGRYLSPWIPPGLLVSKYTGGSNDMYMSWTSGGLSQSGDHVVCKVFWLRGWIALKCLNIYL